MYFIIYSLPGQAFPVHNHLLLCVHINLHIKAFMSGSYKWKQQDVLNLDVN